MKPTITKLPNGMVLADLHLDGKDYSVARKTEAEAVADIIHLATQREAP